MGAAGCTRSHASAGRLRICLRTSDTVYITVRTFFREYGDAISLVKDMVNT